MPKFKLTPRFSPLFTLQKLRLAEWPSLALGTNNRRELWMSNLYSTSIIHIYLPNKTELKTIKNENRASGKHST